jgi:phenylacetate-CoA ligase
MIPDIEKLSPTEIQQAQERSLSEALHYVIQHSAFYQKHFKKNNLDHTKIQTLHDLLLVPPTTKDDMQNFNWDFLCVPRNKVVEYTTTSGTLGKPVNIALTQKDLERLTFNEFISLSCADGTADDLYQLMLTLDRQFMAGIAYYEGIRKIGAGIVRTGPGLPALQIDSILEMQPTILIAVPSFLVKLIEIAQQKGIDLNQSTVKKIVCIGENIRNTDFSLNTLGQKITDQWNVKLYSTYASTEMQTAFTECSHGKGGHHHPGLMITEILDENDKPVPTGQEGELTNTHLVVEGMPLIRYKTGDIVQWHDAGCSCGLTTARISPVIGRKQNMIKLKGTTLYPPGIFEILHQVGVADYVVEVSTNALGIDELKLLIVGDEKTKKEVASIFQSKLRILPEVIVAPASQIEKIHMSEGLRKPKKFIDRR